MEQTPSARVSVVGCYLSWRDCRVIKLCGEWQRC